MSALLKQYFNIAFLMGKPQDLPAGENQMYTAIVLNFITYVVALVAVTGIGSAGIHAALDIACTALFLFLALKYTSRLPRFHQALGAICGAGAVLNLSAIPMLHLALTPADGNISQLAVLSQFVLLVWSLSLAAHVLRHTFDLRMVTSIGVAVAYYLFISTLLAGVLPSSESNADPTSQSSPSSHKQYAVVRELTGDSHFNSPNMTYFRQFIDAKYRSEFI